MNNDQMNFSEPVPSLGSIPSYNGIPTFNIPSIPVKMPTISIDISNPQSEIKDTGIPISEIENNPNYNPESMIGKLKRQSTYVSGKYSQDEELELARAFTKQAYDYYAKQRKNTSPEADRLMIKIKNGYELNDDEILELTSSYEDYKKYKETIDSIEKKKRPFTEIRQRLNSGTITMDDLDFLIEQSGFDVEMANNIRQSFMSSGKIVDSYEEDNMKL
jgi:hypothetical protein